MSAQDLSAIQPDGKYSDLNLADFGFPIFSSFSVKSKIYGQHQSGNRSALLHSQMGWVVGGELVTGRRCRICWMPYSDVSYPVISDSRTNEGVCAAIQKIITRSAHSCFHPPVSSHPPRVYVGWSRFYAQSGLEISQEYCDDDVCCWLAGL